jgi:hypothetical protein
MRARRSAKWKQANDVAVGIFPICDDRSVVMRAGLIYLAGSALRDWNHVAKFASYSNPL